MPQHKLKLNKKPLKQKLLKRLPKLLESPRRRELLLKPLRPQESLPKKKLPQNKQD